MYESPIKIFRDAIGRQIEYDTETGILKAVVNCGVSVDKEELMKALQYDRNQYDKGFSEGYKKGIEDFVEQLEAEIESSDKYIREYDDSEVQKAYNKGLRDALDVAKGVQNE